MPNDDAIELHRRFRADTPEPIILAGVYPAVLTLAERQEWATYCLGSETFRDMTRAEAALTQATRVKGMVVTEPYVNALLVAKRRMVECAKAWLKRKGLEG